MALPWHWDLVPEHPWVPPAAVAVEVPGLQAPPEREHSSEALPLELEPVHWEGVPPRQQVVVLVLAP